MGSLSGARMSDIAFALIPMTAGMVPLLLLRWQLNILTLGDEEARTLGVNVGVLRLIVLLIATLTVSDVVSLTGLISFAGLLAPHGARLLTKNNRVGTMLLSGILGAVILLAADLLARSVAATELPVSIFTSLIGAPFLISLIVRGRKSV